MGLKGFIVRAVYGLVFERGVDLRLFSGRLVKSLIISVKGFESLHRFYASRGLKLFRATPLYNCLTGYLVRGFVDAGEKLCFEVSFVSSDLGEVQKLASVDEAVNIFDARARLEAVSVELVSPENLSIGFRDPGKQVIKMVFESPVILSVKLMTPPVPSIQRKVSRIKTMYVLFPSPAHICSYLVKLWLEAFPEIPIVPLYTKDWAPYLFGRLCEITITFIDFSIKPVTIDYDEKRRIRGFVGWALLDVAPIDRKHIERIDKLFALANYLGIGKSRGVGFGKVKIVTVERRAGNQQKRESSHNQPRTESSQNMQ
jgi:CRISPR-associated endoribonuclease Cas6